MRHYALFAFFLPLLASAAHAAPLRITLTPSFSSPLLESESKAFNAPIPAGGINANILALRELQPKLPGRVDIIGLGIARTDHWRNYDFKNTFESNGGLWYKLHITIH